MSCGSLLLSIARPRAPRIKLSFRTSWRHNALLFESVRKLSTGHVQSDVENLERPVPSKAARGSINEPLSRLNKSEHVSGNERDVGSFESMFKNSKFVRMFDPVGEKVQGEITAVVGEKLYVDFGCKFHAVVKKPEKHKDKFVVGANVVLLLKDLEMTMHPLGNPRDISLLEAEAELCGLSEWINRQFTTCLAQYPLLFGDIIYSCTMSCYYVYWIHNIY